MSPVLSNNPRLSSFVSLRGRAFFEPWHSECTWLFQMALKKTLMTHKRKKKKKRKLKRIAIQFTSFLSLTKHERKFKIQFWSFCSSVPFVYQKPIVERRGQIQIGLLYVCVYVCILQTIQYMRYIQYMSTFFVTSYGGNYL